MKECELSCGNYIHEEEKYCKECMEYEKRKFQKMLHENFDKEEIEVLNIVYDGEALEWKK